jgi:hypothetical protein
MTVKVAGAAGVAVYEMPVEGEVGDDAVVALAEEAMHAAAASVRHQVTVRDVCAQYHVPVAGETLRAEAIVMSMRGASLRLAADVLAGGRHVASFEATA